MDVCPRFSVFVLSLPCVGPFPRPMSKWSRKFQKISSEPEQAKRTNP
jgi:hypothetical protein